MSWWQIILAELLKILPDIIGYISSHSEPQKAFDAFVQHVKDFKKD